jgi:NAD+-dependent protein deacetylase sirtuin 4
MPTEGNEGADEGVAAVALVADLMFAPRVSGAAPAAPSAVEALLGALRGRRVVVLAGAGCSTESGIPDYRGAGARPRVRGPIQFGEFVRCEAARARYWARSAVGWPRLRGSAPNAAHRALAALEAGGVVRGIITQNVDGLHHAAGSRRVVELHGALRLVRCLACDATVDRDVLQQAMLDGNATWAARLLERSAPEAVAGAPDGDADLPDDMLDGFRAPGCARCGGVLKPDVVFFGENVPRARVDEAWELFAEAEVLLVVGSSLTVYSGRRFVYRAVEQGVPIAVVNLGPTRADEVAAVRVEERLGAVLPEVERALLDRGRGGLYHFAILLPDRAALGRLVAHLAREGVRVGAADHLVSEALYLQDPDGLGIEVYADRPRSEWRHRDRQLLMATDPLDLPELARSAGAEPWTGAPAGTRLGHVHLHVGDIHRAAEFYHAALGFDRMVWSYPGALFLAAGGYHHHLGVNTWARRRPAPRRVLCLPVPVVGRRGPRAGAGSGVWRMTRHAGDPANRPGPGRRRRTDARRSGGRPRRPPRRWCPPRR